MYYYGNDFDRMIKAERATKRPSSMSENEWRFHDTGSADPHTCSFDAIFAAYHDYRNSQQWN